MNKRVATTASTGISAILLPKGRTCHSQFRIPLLLREETTCEISKQSSLALYLKSLDVIIIDEVTMLHRFAIEAIDKTMRDLCDIDDPFGGKSVILGADFKQLPAVIDKSDTILNASILSSYLWSKFQNFHLSENMRVGVNAAAFSEFLLSIGNGEKHYSEFGPDFIPIPPQIHTILNSSLDDFIVSVFRNFEEENICNRAILTVKNENASEINNKIIKDFFTSNSHTYFSEYTIEVEDNAFLHPPEFLNQLQPSGFPPHELILKVGIPVMLLRNINVRAGLCNGTRMKITKLGVYSIECKILTGAARNSIVIINKMITTSKQDEYPFVLRRYQLPVKPCFAMTIHKVIFLLSFLYYTLFFTRLRGKHCRRWVYT